MVTVTLFVLGATGAAGAGGGWFRRVLAAAAAPTASGTAAAIVSTRRRYVAVRIGVVPGQRRLLWLMVTGRSSSASDSGRRSPSCRPDACPARWRENR